MKTILVGDCAPDRLYRLSDPDAPTEQEFEFAVAKVLSCIYPAYKCVVFGGTFHLEGREHRPDLALVARDFSHWFIIEVELASHSFFEHVLPQVRAFRYGDPHHDCITILARELDVSRSQAETLIVHVPSTVAVVANRREPAWETGLGALDIQLLAVSVFTSPAGISAVELDGTLHVAREHLGFGRYSVTDKSIRFPTVMRLPQGRLQFDDPDGALSWWMVVHGSEAIWATKEVGTPTIPHGAFVQLVRTFDGRLLLHRTWDHGEPPRGRRYRPTGT